MEPAPQRNSIVSWFFPEPIVPLALPVDDETLRADGPHGARLAPGAVAGRRDRGVRGGGRDVEILVDIWRRADVSGAAQGPDAGHALVVGWGGDVDPVRFACSLFVGVALCLSSVSCCALRGAKAWSAPPLGLVRETSSQHQPAHTLTLGQHRAHQGSAAPRRTGFNSSLSRLCAAKTAPNARK